MSLGIDPSATATGLIVLRATPEEVEVLARRTVKTETKGFERLSFIAGAMVEMVEEHAPQIAMIEGYAFGNAFSLAKLVEVGTTLRWFLLQRGPGFKEVAPLSVKKFATGTGNAKKDQIMKEVWKRWSFDAATSDEADAYVLARIGLCLAGAREAETTAQQEVLKKLQ